MIDIKVERTEKEVLIKLPLDTKIIAIYDFKRLLI